MSERFFNPDLNKKEAVQSPETWLNLHKEAAYKQAAERVKKVLETKGERGIGELFLNLVNEGLKLDGRAHISHDLIKELSYQEVTSSSATEVAGQTITRPVFVFDTVEGFQRFYAALTGVPGTHWDTISSRGFNTELDIALSDGTSERISLIVAPRLNDAISHEVRHTIDPYLHERKGYNRILCELFAYYAEVLRAAEKVSNPMRIWPDLTASVWGRESGYFNEYSQEEENPLSYAEYGKLVQKAVQKIKELFEAYGHLETQRKIVSSKTIQDFLLLK